MTPTVWNGKWRLWGSGNFTTWFSCDFDRPIRQTIFVMRLNTQHVKVGFTVHDAAKVKQILADRGVLDDQQGATPPAKPLPPPRSVKRAPALFVLLILAAVSIGEWVYFYPRMPATVATHFDWGGNADGLGPRQTLLMFPLLDLLVIGIFALVAIACQRTAASVFGQRMLWSGVVVIAFLGVMEHLTYRANLMQTPSMGTAPLYALGAFVLCVVAWLVLLFRRLR
jgi:hypothetical protein